MCNGWLTIRPDTGWLMPLAKEAKKKNETYAGFEWTHRRLCLSYSDVVSAVVAARVNGMRSVWDEVRQQMDERGGRGGGGGLDIPPGHGGGGALHC